MVPRASRPLQRFDLDSVTEWRRDEGAERQARARRLPHPLSTYSAPDGPRATAVGSFISLAWTSGEITGVRGGETKREDRQAVGASSRARAKTMGKGVLEVHLVDAKGLSGNDFLGKIDPYVILKYRSQERKSSVARDHGRNPSWDEVFRFRINTSAANVQQKLVLRIMDHDNFSSDDFLGEATIDVTDIISLGAENGSYQMHPAKHSVVLADNTYRGEIRVGITFTAAQVDDEEDGQQFGGWGNSFRD